MDLSSSTTRPQWLETSGSRSDRFGLEPHSTEVGSGSIKMPQGSPVGCLIVGRGQIRVDVFHRRLEVVQRISQRHQMGSRYQHIVGAEAVRLRQMPAFECALTMAPATVDLGPARAFRSPKCSPAPKTPANGG